MIFTTIVQSVLSVFQALYNKKLRIPRREDMHIRIYIQSGGIQRPPLSPRTPKFPLQSLPSFPLIKTTTYSFIRQCNTLTLPPAAHQFIEKAGPINSNSNLNRPLGKRVNLDKPINPFIWEAYRCSSIRLPSD